MLNNKSILITGGTGFFGRNFIRYIYENYKPARVVVFSRDEAKQFNMQNEFKKKKYKKLKFFIGDVRDKDRLIMNQDLLQYPEGSDLYLSLKQIHRPMDHYWIL